METFSQRVVLELQEMKKLGMRVPQKAITYAQDQEKMKQFDNMKVSEAADLVLQLA